MEALAPAVRLAVGEADSVLLLDNVEVGVSDAVPVPVGVSVGVGLGETLPDCDALPVLEALTPDVRLALGEAESVLLLESVGVADDVAVDEPLPPVVPLLEGVREGLGERLGLAEAVAEAPPAARRYSVPPSSATRMSLLLDSDGEPRTGRASGTDHTLPPELFSDSRLPVLLLTLVPTTSWLKQLKCAGVDSVKVSVVELRL